MQNIKVQPMAAALLALTTAACGGGGGGSGNGDSADSAHAACNVVAGSTRPAAQSPAWLPFVTTSSTGDPQGVQVVPASSLSTAPTFVTNKLVSGTVANELTVYSYALDANGNIVDQAPFAELFASTADDGSAQIFRLPLTGAALPVLQQLGKLDLGSRPICGIGGAPTNLHDPTSTFVIVSVPQDSGSLCTDFGAAMQLYKFQYGDDANTAPVTIAAGSTSPLPLYNADGSLSGLLDSDSSGNLNYYADASYSSPHLLLSNVRFYQTWFYTGHAAYLLAILNGAADALYHLDSSGTLSHVYDVQDPNNFVAFPSSDNANLIISDGTGSGEKFLRMPLDDSAAPQVLYIQGDTNDNLQLVGTTPTKIVLESVTGTSQSGTSLSTLLLTLDIAAPSTPQTIFTGGGQANGGGTTTFSVQSLHGSDAYLTQQTSTASSTATSAVVMNADTGKIESTTKNSAFLSVLSPYNYWFGGFSGVATAPQHVLEFTGLPANSGGFTGGTLNKLDLNTCAFAAMTSPAGVPYVMPQYDFFQFYDFGTVGGSMIDLPASNSNGFESDAMVYDLSKNQIVQATNTPDSEEYIFLR